MLKDITLGQFFPGESFIHRLDPRTKLIMVIVYIVALFLAKGGTLERLSPDRAISLAELGEELKMLEKSKIVVGDGAKLCYNTLTEQGLRLELAPEHLRMQSGWGVARAAEELAKQGQLIKGVQLNAVYHRLSQAERERLEKEKS